jgi:hypothetical protein
MKRYRLLHHGTAIYANITQVGSLSAITTQNQRLTTKDCFVILESYSNYIHLILAADKTGWVYITPGTLAAAEVTES